MSIYELVDQVNELASEQIRSMDMVNLYERKIGLDGRVGTIWICEEAIAVRKSNRGTADYYGGLEYVEKECVKEIGDYVFYLAEDDRIQGHIDRYYEN